MSDAIMFGFGRALGDSAMPLAVASVAIVVVSAVVVAITLPESWSGWRGRRTKKPAK